MTGQLNHPPDYEYSVEHTVLGETALPRTARVLQSRLDVKQKVFSSSSITWFEIIEHYK